MYFFLVVSFILLSTVAHSTVYGEVRIYRAAVVAQDANKATTVDCASEYCPSPGTAVRMLVTSASPTLVSLLPSHARNLPLVAIRGNNAPYTLTTIANNVTAALLGRTQISSRNCLN